MRAFLRNSKSLNHISVYRRCFSKQNILQKKLDESPNIPLISPLFNKRLLGQSHFITSIDEEALIELMISLNQNNGDKAMTGSSEVKFENFKNFPRKKTLPEVPPSLNNPQVLRDYVNELTRFRYPKFLTSNISSMILAIVNEHPESLTKNEYLNIVKFLHHFDLDYLAFQVLDKMRDSTSFYQDTDFDNLLLFTNDENPDFKRAIDRLERYKAINNNTWYTIFNLIKTNESKMKVLQLMKDFKINLNPIITGMKSIVSNFEPEELIEIYKASAVDEDNMTPDQLNQLVCCILEKEGPEKAWNYITSMRNYNERFINNQIFETFGNYFAKTDQLAYLIAFSKFLHSNFQLKTYYSLIEIILSEYLVNCQIFDNWPLVTKIYYYKFENLRNLRLHKNTISNLQDYANLNNIDLNLQGLKLSANERLLMNKIEHNLTWDNTPIFKLCSNTGKFKSTAKAIGQKE